MQLYQPLLTSTTAAAAPATTTTTAAPTKHDCGCFGAAN